MVRDVQHNPGILQQSFTSLDSSASFWRSTETKNKSSSLFSSSRFTGGLTTMSDGKSLVDITDDDKVLRGDAINEERL